MTINLLREGLFFKYSDFQLGKNPQPDIGDFATGLRFIITLAGETKLEFGKQQIHLCGRNRPAGLCLPISHTELGAKYFVANDSQKELVIFVELEWLNNSGLIHSSDYSVLSQLEQAHLTAYPLCINKTHLMLIEQIIQQIEHTSVIAFLTKESLCIKLLAELLGQLPLFQPQAQSTKRQRIYKLTELLLSGKADNWNLEQMAQFSHTNITTLQNDFKNIQGTTIMRYLRQLKLERAYNALVRGESILLATEIAGYTDPDNFSTAFRRYFGLRPSEVRKQALLDLNLIR